MGRPLDFRPKRNKGNRYRLTDEEAKAFGLNPTSTGQYRLTPLKEKIWLSGEDVVGNAEGIIRECEAHGVSPKVVKGGWLKSKESSLSFNNPLYDNGEITLDDVRNETIQMLQEYSPNFPKIKRRPVEGGHLLVLDPADIHIGKLATICETGEAYNQEIARTKVLQGVKEILHKAKPYNIEKILFVGGNDILHTDTPKRTTTSGTSQDTDGMWHENYKNAQRLYIDIIMMCLEMADVHFVHNPSNHDYMSGFMLCDSIQAYFHKSKNITFDVSINHRKYFLFGNSLIGTTHGDGAKQVDLGSLMSIEAKEHWAAAEYRYYYTHHIHHKTSKEYINVMVESLRSPSSADSWHHRNGYVNKPAIEGFIHSKDKGQVSRITEYV